jgi:hypothetical protein
MLMVRYPGGNYHPADRGDDRERRLPPRRQFAGQELALDLQPDEQKEDGHEAIVDPLMQRESEGRSRKPDRNLGLPQVMIFVRPRGVRPRERNRRAREEDRAAERSCFREVLKRAEEPVPVEARCRRVRTDAGHGGHASLHSRVEAKKCASRDFCLRLRFTRGPQRACPPHR